MKVSILTIGDELLIGQVLNSNVQWMSEKLTDLGCDVICHLTIGDKFDEIEGALTSLVKKSDAVIIGGGLGPTHDDLTMEALSKFTSTPLEMDEEWIGRVEAFFKSRNRVMSQNNRKQGLLLKGATRIDNDCGTAAGQHLRFKNTEIFVVPGVPHEMKSMMTRYILPKLGERTLSAGEKILKQTLLTTGIGESALAERLDPFVQKIKSMPAVTLAFLPSTIVVRLRLLMKASSAADEAVFQGLVDELRTGCGKDFFGCEPLTLEESVVNSLIGSERTLAVAESCTGGLIAHRLTGVAGASGVLRGAVVAYQEETKTLELGIPAGFLKSHGVVSEATARAMAESLCTKWGTDFALATTGYLGPGGGTDRAPLGTVWIALARADGKTIAREFRYEANRERSKDRAAQSALDLLRREL
ncbi:MAG: competence/damage-inducible protein A [Proteobacteria bacterium]|nr:competence/damage-inducible protein A [Pseudomonadota bacterium]